MTWVTCKIKLGSSAKATHTLLFAEPSLQPLQLFFPDRDLLCCPHWNLVYRPGRSWNHNDLLAFVSLMLELRVYATMVFRFFYFCFWVFACVYVSTACEWNPFGGLEEGVGTPGSSYRFWVRTRVLGTEPWSFASTASAFNHWTISLVPLRDFCFVF